MHPKLTVPFLEAFDWPSAEAGAERNHDKTLVSMLLPKALAWEHQSVWQPDQLGERADVCFEVLALGAETGDAQAVVWQFEEKIFIADSMLKRLPLCQDAQVELVLQRKHLGLSKVNHPLRTGSADWVEKRHELNAFDTAQERCLCLVPGLTPDGLEQALRVLSLGGVCLLSAERQAAAGNLA